MYEDRSLAQAKPTADQFGMAPSNLRTKAPQRASDEFTTLVFKNLLVWGSAAVSCGIIYLMFNLFI